MLNRKVLWELAGACVIGLLLAASPMTGVQWGLSLATGGVVAAAIFGFRMWRGAGRAQEDPAVASEAPRVGVPLAVWICLGLWLVVFWPTLEWLYDSLTRSVWTNNHGLFIPPLVAWLTWDLMRRDANEAEENSPWGFVFVGAGCALAAVDSVLATRYLSVAACLLTLPGLSLLLLGPRRTRVLAIPLALSVLAFPIPNAVATDLYLRQMTAAGVEPILHLLGLSAFREQTVIHMASNTFIVSNACSGFATLYASISVAIILATQVKSPGRRVALLLLAPPMAIAANVLRVLILVLLTLVFGNWVIDSPLHPGSGVAAFALVLVILLAIARDSGRARPPAPPPAQATAEPA